MLDDYALEYVVRQRLAELRASAASHASGDAMSSPRRPLRVLLGMALIRAGRRLVGRTSAPTRHERLAGLEQPAA